MDNDEVVDEGQDIAWWLKWLTRGVGAVGGITAAIGGALGTFISFNLIINLFSLIINLLLRCRF